MNALSLFSGGLDSLLAIKVVQAQGINVIALNFVSYFFGGRQTLFNQMAESYCFQLEYIDFKTEHAAIVESPSQGYGKNMNPCLDCHALMIKKAGQLLDQFQAKFIITGEVLGQRPMSQNSQALRRVEKLSGMQGYIVRPLSAKWLPITIAEEYKWLDRDKLLDIQGRGRKRQIELASQYDLTQYPSPAGGCSLTDPNYSRRLKLIKDDRQFHQHQLFTLLKLGRFYRLEPGKYIIIGRNDQENKILKSYQTTVKYYITGHETIGPDLLLIGAHFSPTELNLAKKLFSRYSKAKGREKTTLLINGSIEEVPPLNLHEIERLIKQYQI